MVEKKCDLLEGMLGNDQNVCPCHEECIYSLQKALPQYIACRSLQLSEL